MKEGLAPADALKVKWKPKVANHEGVDPALSDEMMPGWVPEVDET